MNFPKAFRIKGISHITFICKDLEKTTRMLKEMFDAEEIYSSGEKTFSITKEKFFNVAGFWIAIMEGEPIEKSYNHIAFQVSDKDIDSLAEKAKALGLEVLPSRSRHNEEGSSLYFYDYDNHLFELHSGDLDTRLKFYNSNQSNNA
jgi:fosfomycin resistance protein FosX